MKKPDIKDYPPRNPHELEWGGCNPQYFNDMEKWESLQKYEAAVERVLQVSKLIHTTVIMPK